MDWRREVAGLGFLRGGGGVVLLLAFVAAATSAAELGRERGLGRGLLNELGVTKDRKENCSYTVIIETTCLKEAGTTDPVSLRFGDSSSNDILLRHLHTSHVKRVDSSEATILDDVPRKAFQECAIDAFKATGKCVQSQVCYLYLKLKGDDDWQPGRAQVLVHEVPSLSSNTFYFRRFIPRHVWNGFDACSAEVTPFGVKHPRKVFSNNSA